MIRTNAGDTVLAGQETANTQETATHSSDEVVNKGSGFLMPPIGLAGNKSPVRSSPHQELADQTMTNSSIDVAQDMLKRFYDHKAVKAIENVMDKIDNALDKFLDNKVVDKVSRVLVEPIYFTGYLLDRIYYRSEALQKHEAKMDELLDRWTAYKVGKETGLSAEQYFNWLQKDTDRCFADAVAKVWANRVGASAEAEREYADNHYLWNKSTVDYERLTRNEFKKKYPQIETVEVENTDLAHKRPSLARIVKSIRGYRRPSQAERRAFSPRVRSQLGLEPTSHQIRSGSF